jgi:hypothetical protein
VGGEDEGFFCCRLGRFNVDGTDFALGNFLDEGIDPNCARFRSMLDPSPCILGWRVPSPQASFNNGLLGRCWRVWFCEKSLKTFTGELAPLEASRELWVFGEPCGSPGSDVSDERPVFAEDLALPSLKSLFAGSFAGCKDQRLNEFVCFVIAPEGVARASSRTLG